MTTTAIIPPSFHKSLANCALCLAFTMTSGVTAFAQGFNWQYSPRYPTEYPRLFVGISGGGGGLVNLGSLSYTQSNEDSGGECQCATYQRGSGRSVAFGLHGEYWLENGTTALYASLRYERFWSSFSVPYDNGPRINGEHVITNFLFDATLGYATTEFGIKYKFFPLHFFVAGGVEIGARVFNGNAQQEVVQSPTNFTFRNGQQQRSVGTDGILMNPVLVGGKVSVGYDLPLANGFYASPAVYIAAPLLSIAQGAQWRWISYGGQISFVYGWR